METWFFYLILGAFPALIAFAAVYKYVEVMRASRCTYAAPLAMGTGSRRQSSANAGAESRGWSGIL